MSKNKEKCEKECKLPKKLKKGRDFLKNELWKRKEKKETPKEGKTK